jgi:hypothetical protein
MEHLDGALYELVGVAHAHFTTTFTNLSGTVITFTTCLPAR